MDETHVDVIKNEWLAGVQFVVAKVLFVHGGLHVESAEPAVWEPIVLRPYVLRGEELHAEKDPEAFLEGLADVMNGTYLFATRPHSPHECAWELPVERLVPAHVQPTPA